MPTSPYTRFFFGHLIPGSALACAVLFLVDVPTDEGYRISLLEWSLDSDRVFPYVVALGLVGSALLGSLLQAARMLVVDAWALSGRVRAAAPPAPPPEGTAGDGPAGAPADAPPAAAARPPRPRRAPGPLAELHGNLGLALVVAVLWITVKIIRGGGTEVFPGRVAYGVPLAGLAAAALLFGAYRHFGGRGPGGSEVSIED
jgi:hypothetical protein